MLHRAADPLALDPLGPMWIDPNLHAYSTPDALALDPLAPVDAGARPIDADSEHTSKETT